MPRPHRRGHLPAPTSALPLKADVCHCVRHVAEGPIGDILDRGLKEQYDAPQSLSERLAELVRQIEHEDARTGGDVHLDAADYRFILEQEPRNRVSPHVNAGRGKLLFYGYPAVRILARLVCRAFFYFTNPQSRRETRAHHAISRAAAFMSRLTSTQVPRGAPQFLHDKTVSLVGASGRSSRPPHFPHLKFCA
jgi:hypothetical protein